MICLLQLHSPNNHCDDVAQEARMFSTILNLRCLLIFLCNCPPRHVSLPHPHDNCIHSSVLVRISRHNLAFTCNSNASLHYQFIDESVLVNFVSNIGNIVFIPSYKPAPKASRKCGLPPFLPHRIRDKHEISWSIKLKSGESVASALPV